MNDQPRLYRKPAQWPRCRRKKGHTFGAASLMMNLLILAGLFLGPTIIARAQVAEPAAYKNLLPRFTRFYNTGAADSLYALFDAKMQAALPPEKTKEMVTQLKAQLGDLQLAVPAESTSLSVSYKATFSKSVVMMLVSINPEGKMQGLFFQPYKEKETVKAAPGLTETPQTLTAGKTKLSGSLILPGKMSNKIPLVIMVAGSGPTDRYGNSAVISASPYRYLSNSLGENGLATLLYDKRMTGQSTSAQKETDLRFTDYVADLILWIKKYKADGRFSKIIIAGHSEGSLVGMLAAEQEKVAGFISLSGPGRPIKEVLKEQLKADENPEVGAKLDSLEKGLKVNAAADDVLFRPSSQPYLTSWMKFDPAAEIRKLKIPVLIIQGSTDLQVGLNDAGKLKAAGKHATLKLITGMNHVFKEAPADRQQNRSTYKNPDLPLQKELVPAIVTFVSALK